VKTAKKNIWKTYGIENIQKTYENTEKKHSENIQKHMETIKKHTKHSENI